MVALNPPLIHGPSECLREWSNLFLFFFVKLMYGPLKHVIDNKATLEAG